MMHIQVKPGCQRLQAAYLSRPKVFTARHSQPSRRRRPGLLCRSEASGNGRDDGKSLVVPVRHAAGGLELTRNEADQPGSSTSEQEAAAQKDKAAAEQHKINASWSDWLEYFKKMDHAAQTATVMEQKILHYADFGQYQAAAKLQQELEKANEVDELAAMLKELQNAIDQEDFARASQLRDEGCTALNGWWWARSKDDPQGHLLHISHFYGRYIGLHFTPKDLTELKATSVDSISFHQGPPGMPHGPLPSSTQDTEPDASDPKGTAVMEVYMRRGPDGNFQRQAVVLNRASEEAAAALQELAGAETTGTVVVEQGNDEEGNPVTRITMRSNSPSGSSKQPYGRFGRSSGGLAGMGAGVRGGDRASSGWLIGDGSEDLSQEEAMSRLMTAGGGDSPADADKSQSADSEKELKDFNAMRSPASLTILDRNNFVLAPVDLPGVDDSADSAETTNSNWREGEGDSSVRTIDIDDDMPSPSTSGSSSEVQRVKKLLLHVHPPEATTSHGQLEIAGARFQVFAVNAISLNDSTNGQSQLPRLESQDQSEQQEQQQTRGRRRSRYQRNREAIAESKDATQQQGEAGPGSNSRQYSGLLVYLTGMDAWPAEAHETLQQQLKEEVAVDSEFTADQIMVEPVDKVPVQALVADAAAEGVKNLGDLKSQLTQLAEMLEQLTSTTGSDAGSGRSSNSAAKAEMVEGLLQRFMAQTGQNQAIRSSSFKALLDGSNNSSSGISTTGSEADEAPGFLSRLAQLFRSIVAWFRSLLGQTPPLTEAEQLRVAELDLDFERTLKDLSNAGLQKVRLDGHRVLLLQKLQETLAEVSSDSTAQKSSKELKALKKAMQQAESIFSEIVKAQMEEVSALQHGENPDERLGSSLASDASPVLPGRDLDSLSKRLPNTDAGSNADWVAITMQAMQMMELLTRGAPDDVKEDPAWRATKASLLSTMRTMREMLAAKASEETSTSGTDDSIPVELQVDADGNFSITAASGNSDDLKDRKDSNSKASSSRDSPAERLSKVARRRAERRAKLSDAMSDDKQRDIDKVLMELMQKLHSGQSNASENIAALVGRRLQDSKEGTQKADDEPHMLRYTRLPTEFPDGDELSGVYMGGFGAHGPEVVVVERQLKDGEEWVVATKATGDINVPAGAVTFKAKVARQHRRQTYDDLPMGLGVQSSYPGSGCIADPGHRNPRWVSGTLLQFAEESPLGRGAELGFVWNMPGQKRYLILLTKLDLEGAARMISEESD